MKYLDFNTGFSPYFLATSGLIAVLCFLPLTYLGVRISLADTFVGILAARAALQIATREIKKMRERREKDRQYEVDRLAALDAGMSEEDFRLAMLFDGDWRERLKRKQDGEVGLNA